MYYINPLTAQLTRPKTVLACSNRSATFCTDKIIKNREFATKGIQHFSIRPSQTPANHQMNQLYSNIYSHGIIIANM